MVKRLRSQPLSHVDKHRVAGIHRSLEEGLGTVAARFMAADPPVLHNPETRTKKTIRKTYGALLQSGGRRYDLKGRTWFIRIVDAAVPPHLVQRRLHSCFCGSVRVLLCFLPGKCFRCLRRSYPGKRFRTLPRFRHLPGGRIPRQGKGIVEVKFRGVDHGVNLAVPGIHNNDRDGLSAFLLHYLIGRLLRVFLNVHIQTHRQRVPRNRFDPLLSRVLQFNTPGVGRCQKRPVHSL